MYFSGKVTNSVITHLIGSGVDLGRIYESTDLPSEFLRDPTCWLEAIKVEEFLRAVEAEFVSQFPGQNLIEKVGHESYELRSWGVLDSVLKMMIQPQDIFTQPQRFISYFVSPAPPIGNLERRGDFVSFDLPISHSEFPFVTEYIRSALEALPNYMGRSSASVSWRGTRVEVDWSEKQESLLDDEHYRQHLDPQFVRNLMKSFEDAQLELEKKSIELRDRESEICKLKSQLEDASSQLGSSDLSSETEVTKRCIQQVAGQIEAPLANIQNQFLRMGDYLARSQQLVTLLSGQSRKDPQVKEAMKRVDWDYIRSNFSNIVQGGVSSVESIRKQLQDAKVREGREEVSLDGKVDVNLDTVVTRAVDLVSSRVDRDVQIARMLFFDKDIKMDPNTMEEALVGILEQAVRSVESRGQIQVVTRPRGTKAEIEITESGKGQTSFAMDTWDGTDRVSSIVKNHGGDLCVSHGSGEGQTYVIELPAL